MGTNQDDGNIGIPPAILGAPQTVEVRIVRGKYIPCHQCHWFTICVVPKGRFMPNARTAEIRNIYQCLDFLPNKPPIK